MTIETNVLYYGDNLPILRKYIPDGSIDLIYLDPPFNSKATYNVLFKEPTGEPSNAQVTAFEDTWHWTEETEKTYQEIEDTAPANVVNLMVALKDAIGKNDMMAYLTMMCIRLLELRRVLKDTGSIYLHCDPTASHYLKIVMDAIFDVKNFRNEIVWCYTGREAPVKHKFSRKHDSILYYTKTDNYVFNVEYEPYDENYVKLYFTHKDECGRFFQWQPDGKGGRYKQYLDKSKGIPLRDWWEIKPVHGVDYMKRNETKREWQGYPTQKPEALLERIIKTSSNEGDIVLDPFCGCGTAVVVAQRLNRGWIGIDITHLAVSLMKWRLNNYFPNIQFKTIGEPKDLSGARELAKENRYQFQWWALSLIDARPYGDKKKGADTGIDGYSYFNDGGKTNKVVVQVKSGNVSVNQIRDLISVVDRENASMGFFITLEEPTRPMKEEATKKGFYTDSFGNQYQKVQILTIEELFNGKKPDMPQKVSAYNLNNKRPFNNNERNEIIGNQRQLDEI